MKNIKLIAKLGLVAIVAAAFFMLAITSWIIDATSPEMGIYTGAISGFTLLIILLEIRQIRFLKGMVLIGYGVIFQAVFSRYYYFCIGRDNPNFESLSMQLDLYMQVLLFACAGAGGSIIANHADKSSSDYEHKLPSNEVIDNTKRIDSLIVCVNRTEKKLNLSIALSLALTVITLIIVIFMLFR
ncbi:hypothetical protein JJD84_14270 [Pseudomonas fluorescens]|nr:hypothetical protein [Pseudomonas fluorescens]